MKRLGLGLLLLVAVICVFAFGPTVALADDPADYTVVGGVLTAYTGAGGNITIPGTVTDMGTEVFKNNTTITGVTIPSSVTDLGLSTFMGCTQLSSITLPTSISIITNKAFYGCDALQNITFPSSVTEFEYGAFASCDGLLNVTFETGVTEIGDSAFYACSSLAYADIADSVTIIGTDTFGSAAAGFKFICNSGSAAHTYATTNGIPVEFRSDYIISGGVLTEYVGAGGNITIPNTVTSIADDVFLNNTTITSVVMQSGLSQIGSNVFDGCTNMASVTLPSTLSTIGVEAFKGCSLLGSVTIPSGVSSLANGVFNTCSTLSTVILPSGLQTIGDSTFIGCSGLSSITIPSGVTGIGADAFNGTGIVSFTTPSGLTTLSEGLFANNTALTNITLNSGLTTIESNAFYGCTSLASISMPDTVTTLSTGMFLGCTSLASVDLSSAATSIPGFAFYGCTLLTEIDIPTSVGAIGSYAFENCSGLLRVHIPNSVLGIGTSAFSGCHANLEIYCKSTSTAATYASTNGIDIFDLDDLTIIDGHLNWYSGSGGDVTIPFMVDFVDNSVFLGKSSITRIELEEGVQSIGSGSFRNCSNLAEVVMPSTLTSIGGGAFFGCSNLTIANLPSGLTSMGNTAFQNCGNLMNVTIPAGLSTIPGSAYEGCDGITGLTITSGVSTIESQAFYGCTSLGSVTIPNSVNTMGEGVFSNCSQLSTVTLSTNLTEINNYMFYASGLTSITIPSGVDTIGNKAFDQCMDLVTVNLPSSIDTIGYQAFRSCRTLANITLPAGVSSLGYEAFNDCQAIASISIPTSLSSLPEKAFYRCGSLSSITIPGNITSIGTSAFAECYDISTLTMNSGVETIGANAFDSCSNISSISMPTSLRTIGNSAFQGCTNLSGTLTIPEGVDTIGDYAFYLDFQITGISLPSTLDSIGTDAFRQCSGINTSVAIPSGVSEIKARTFKDCTGLPGFTLPSTVTSIGEEAFYKCSAMTSITIPSTVDSIGVSAFEQCTGVLGTLTIPEGVETIEQSAFSLCSKVTGLSLPSTLTSIGVGAFNQCYDLNTAVTIPGGVTNLSNNAFSSCFKLPEVTLSEGVETIGVGAFFGNALLSVVSLPDSLTEIDQNAFLGCALTDVVIPNNVTTIHCKAFQGNSGLANVQILKNVTSIGANELDPTGIDDLDIFKDCHPDLVLAVDPGSAAETYAIDHGLSMTYFGFTIVDGVLTAYTGTGGDVTIPRKDVDGSDVYKIDYEVFMDNTTVTSVTIPDTITEIGFSAFKGCTNMTSVTLPDSLAKMGPRAFENCTALSSIVIPGSLSKLEGYMFSDCTGLTEVTIGEGVEEIEQVAFQDCTSLVTVNLPTSLRSIGNYAFNYCEDIVTMNLPEGLETLGLESLGWCTKMITVNIPSTLTDIGENTFNSCSALEFINVASGSSTYRSIDGVLFTADGTKLIKYPRNKGGASYDVPYGVKIIGEYAFFKNDITGVNLPIGLEEIETDGFGYSWLTSIDLPSTLTKLGPGAFEFTSISSVTIPGGVKEIGSSCFANTSLNDVTISEGVEKIGSYAFKYTYVPSYSIPASVNEIGEFAFEGCVSTTEFDVEEENVNFKDVDGVLFSKDGKKLIRYPGNKDGATYTVPEGVTELCEDAFSSCAKLTDITLSETLRTIGDRSFRYNSNLDTLTIYERVNDIQGDAGTVFYDCTLLNFIGYEECYARDYAVAESIPYTVIAYPDGVIFEDLEDIHVDEGAGIDVLGHLIYSGVFADADSEFKFSYRMQGETVWTDMSGWLTQGVNTDNFVPAAEGIYQIRIEGRRVADPATVYEYISSGTQAYRGALPVEGMNIAMEREEYKYNDKAIAKDRILEFTPQHAQGQSDAHFKVLYSVDNRNWKVMILDPATRTDLGGNWYEFVDGGGGIDSIKLQLPDVTRDTKFYIKVETRADGREINGSDTVDISKVTDPITVYMSVPPISLYIVDPTSTIVYDGTPIELEAYAQTHAQYPDPETIVEYRFSYRLVGTARWLYVSTAFDSNTTIDFTPAKEGKYEFKVEAKSQGRRATDLMDVSTSANIYFDYMPAKSLEVGVENDKTMFEATETIPLEITAEGNGSEDMEYMILSSTNGRAYRATAEWGGWKDLTVDSNNEATYDYILPPTRRDTHYYIKVMTRTKGRTTEDQSDIVEIDAYTVMPLASVSIDLSAVVSEMPADGVTLSANAVAETGYEATTVPEYRFMYRAQGSSRWSYISTRFSTTNSVKFKPRNEGTYYFKVEAKAQGRLRADVTDKSWTPYTLYFEKAPADAVYDVRFEHQTYENADIVGANKAKLSFNITNTNGNDLEYQILTSSNGRTYRALPEYSDYKPLPSGAVAADLDINLPAVRRDSLVHVRVNLRAVGRTTVDAYGDTRVQIYTVTPLWKVDITSVGDNTSNQVLNGSPITIMASANMSGLTNAMYTFFYRLEGTTRWIPINRRAQIENTIEFLPRNEGKYEFKVDAYAVGRRSKDVSDEWSEAVGLYFTTMGAKGMSMTPPADNALENNENFDVTFDITKNDDNDDVEYQIAYSTNGRTFRPLSGYDWGEKDLGAGTGDTVTISFPSVTRDTKYYLRVNGRTEGRTTTDVYKQWIANVYTVKPIAGLVLNYNGDNPKVVGPAGITLEAQAQRDGGNVDADYKFYYKPQGGRRWMAINRAYSTDKEIDFHPTAEGVYEFKVEAKAVGRLRPDLTEELGGTVALYFGKFPADGVTVTIPSGETKYKSSEANFDIDIDVDASDDAGSVDTEWQMQYSTNGRTYRTLAGYDWADLGTGDGIVQKAISLDDPRRDTHYYLKVNVRSKGRLTTDVSDVIEVDLYTVMPVENLSLDEVNLSGLEIDGGIRLFASASGEKDVEYRFQYRKEGTLRWSYVTSRFSHESDGTGMAIYKPRSEGYYYFRVQARRIGRRPVDIEDTSVKTGVFYGHQPVDSVDVNTGNVPRKFMFTDNVEVSVSVDEATGETSEYQIQYSKDNRRWTTLKGYDWKDYTGAMFLTIIFPESEDDTMYYVKVNARSKGRTTVDEFDTCEIKLYSIMPIKSVDLTGIVIANGRAALAATATAEDGHNTDDALYKFYYRDNGARVKRWVACTSFMSENQTLFTPSYTSKYDFKVEVVNQGRLGVDTYDIDTNGDLGYEIEIDD